MKPSASRLIFASLLLLASGLFASSASAEERTRYEMFWRIEPVKIPESDFWVREQGTLLASRLIPLQMYVATADIVAEDGTRLAPLGTQFASVFSSANTIACMATVPREGVTRERGWESRRRRVCLIDSGNGFRSAFSTREKHDGRYYRLNDEVPEELINIPLAILEQADALDFSDSPVAELHYQRILDQGNAFQMTLDRRSGVIRPDAAAVRFDLRIGRGRGRDWFSGHCNPRMLLQLCAYGQVPMTFSILGVEGRILERDGESLRFELTRSFTPIPIATNREVYNRPSEIYTLP